MTDAELDNAVARLNEELLRRERKEGSNWQDRDIMLVLAALAERTHNAAYPRNPCRQTARGVGAAHPTRLQCSPKRSHLSAKEFRLLESLLERPGVVFSREHLLERISGSSVDITDRAVDVYIARLRKALSRGRAVVNATRSFASTALVTVSMRLSANPSVSKFAIRS